MAALLAANRNDQGMYNEVLVETSYSKKKAWWLTNSSFPKLLLFLRLLQLLLLLLQGFCGASDISAHGRIPPSEGARVVAQELFVVHIVVICACPERQEMMQRPREFVARMRVNGLEQSSDNPQVHGNNMEILGEGAERNWNADTAKRKDHGLQW